MLPLSVPLVLMGNDDPEAVEVNINDLLDLSLEGEEEEEEEEEETSNVTTLLGWLPPLSRRVLRSGSGVRGTGLSGVAAEAVPVPPRDAVGVRGVPAVTADPTPD